MDYYMDSPTTPHQPNSDGSAAPLHRLVRPFLRENTAMWREREDIRFALEALKDGASEALLCLKGSEPQRQPLQASAALAELECEIEKLWPNAPGERPGADTQDERKTR